MLLADLGVMVFFSTFLSTFISWFQEKLVEMIVNSVECIDKIAYSLMKSIGDDVRKIHFCP